MQGPRTTRTAAILAAVLLLELAAACGSQLPAGSTVRVPVPSIPTAQSTQAYEGAQLMSLALATTKIGYGLFAQSDGSGCEALSGYTTDGGTDFRSASEITVCGSVQYMAVDGAGAAFAYGPDLFIKGNARSPWRRSPQPGAVLALSAMGRSVWLLLAECHGSDVTPSGCALDLVESANGGQTWHSSGALPQDAVTPGNSSGPLFQASDAGQTWLVRTGLSAGYVTAVPSAVSGGRPTSAPLWYTGNSGASWSQRSLDCGLDAQTVVVSAAPDGTLAAVCAAEPSAGNQVKTTLTSANGGLTWTLHAGCGTAAGCQDPLDSGYLGQIAAVSAQTFFLTGDRTSLLVTMDGGQRWSAVRPLIGDSSEGSSQVQFFGTKDGIVLAASGSTGHNWDIFRTSDGGRTWSGVIPELGP